MISNIVLEQQERHKMYLPFFQKLFWQKKYEVGDFTIIYLKDGKKYINIGEAKVLDVKVTTLRKLPNQTAFMTLGMNVHDYLINHYKEHTDVIDDLEKHEIYIYLFKIIHRKDILDEEMRIFIKGY